MPVMLQLHSLLPKIWKYSDDPSHAPTPSSPASSASSLFASATPSPLYGTYRELWGFSPAVLTLVYATYAFGVLAALLLAGRVSDEVGRRPVLIVALSTLLVTSVLFMVADSVAWLFVARGLQGLATGLALGAASAAMLDLHARRDPAGVGLANGVVSAAGMGLGVLVASALVEWLPAPRVLPYVVLLVLFAVALAGAILMPEPVREPLAPEAHPAAPARAAGGAPPVPARRAGRALLVVDRRAVPGARVRSSPRRSSPPTTTWSPGWARSCWPAPARWRSCCSAGAWRRGAARRSARSRWPVGVLLIVGAASTESAALLLTGAVVGGAGFGLAFLGALRALSGVIPPAAPRRGDVGLLRRRLRGALAARGGGRVPRHADGPGADVRAVRLAWPPPSRWWSPSRRGARARPRRAPCR